MTDIELRNENGKLVGYDIETGEKVPVSFEALEAESVSSGSVNAGEAGIGLHTQPHRQLVTDYEKQFQTSSVGQIQCSFEDFPAGWTVPDGNATRDTETVYLGTQSVHMDSSGAENASIEKAFDTAQDLTETDFSLAVKPESTTNSQIQVRLHLRDSAGNQHLYRQFINKSAMGRWIRLDFGIEDDGDPLDYADITEIQISVFDGSDSTTFNIDDLRLHDRPTKAYVFFTFDDAQNTDYTEAFPTLGKYGYTGMSFVPTSFIGEDGRLSLSQMKEMQARGWEFGSHTVNHVHLSHLSREEQKAELSQSKKWLLENGFHRGARHFRTPYGDYDTDSLDLLPEYYEASYAGAAETGANLRATETRLLRMNNGDDYTAAQTVVDDAVATNRLVGFTLHEVTDPSGFESLISHVRSYEKSGDLEVITPSYLLDNLNRLHFTTE